MMFVNSSTDRTLYINMVDALKSSGGSGNCEICINPKDGDQRNHSKSPSVYQLNYVSDEVTFRREHNFYSNMKLETTLTHNLSNFYVDFYLSYDTVATLCVWFFVFVGV